MQCQLGLCFRLHMVSPCVSASKLPSLSGSWSHQNLLFPLWSRIRLCDPTDSSLPGSSVHGISQAIILEWAAISFSSGASWCRDWTRVSCIVGRFFYHWATWEALISEWSEVKWSEVKPLSCGWLFATPWTVAYLAPPSMGFSKQQYWSGLPFPSQSF